MQNKKNIISILMLSLYAAMFALFVIAIFFIDSIVAGSVYFIIFAMSVTFTIIEKKYGMGEKSYYRYSIILSDVINILAGIFMVLNNIYILCFGSSIAFFISSFIVDVTSKNMNKTNNKLSYITLGFNSLFMLACFPYFFDFKLGFAVALIAVWFAAAVFVLKTVLAFSNKRNIKVEKESKSEEISDNTESIE